MANFVKGSLNFAVKSVTPAQKSSVANSDPQLIVANAGGKFTLTGAASSVLGVQPGDSIAFMDNLSDILAAIAAKADAVVEAFEAAGADINNADDCEEFVKAMRQTYIYKGFALLEADGSPKMVNARTTKEEKEALVAEHRDEIVAALEEAGVEATEENILKAASKQEQAVKGSKLANLAGMSGYGLTLTFTDSNIANSLKRDIEPEIRNTIKRTLKVDIKNPETKTENNGYEDIEVTVYPVSFYSDTTVNRSSDKDDESED